MMKMHPNDAPMMFRLMDALEVAAEVGARWLAIAVLFPVALVLTPLFWIEAAARRRSKRNVR